jgi:hypothetical protein
MELTDLRNSGETGTTGNDRPGKGDAGADGEKRSR